MSDPGRRTKERLGERNRREEKNGKILEELPHCDLWCTAMR